MIVCDTGPLVAAALTNDDDHVPCVELLTGMHLAGRPLLVPGPVVAEVGYLLEREGGPLVEALFLRFGGSPPRARRRPKRAAWRIGALTLATRTTALRYPRGAASSTTQPIRS